MNLYRIARPLNVGHKAVANLVAAHTATLPAASPAPDHERLHPLPVVKLAELYTSAGEK